VVAIDPHCAMAQWGIAMTLFQPLWPTRPGPSALEAGWQAVEKARALQPPTEREQLFIAAAEAFFLDPTSTDYWLRIRRWEQAMQKVYETFPDDSEAATFYARLGDWNGVIRGNLRAAQAALDYPAGEHGEFVWDEFCHAIEYLVYGYLQKHNYAAAAAQLQRLRSTKRIEPTFKLAFHLMSTQARYALERKAWNEAVQIVPRQPATLNWDRFT